MRATQPHPLPAAEASGVPMRPQTLSRNSVSRPLGRAASGRLGPRLGPWALGRRLLLSSLPPLGTAVQAASSWPVLPLSPTKHSSGFLGALQRPALLGR